MKSCRIPGVHHINRRGFIVERLTLRGAKVTMTNPALRGQGITFDLPDINAGTYRFEPIADDRVRYGLGAIKGTGQSAKLYPLSSSPQHI